MRSSTLRLLTGILLLLLGGCTRLDLAVKWADTYFLSSLEDYFDLPASQREDIRKDFNLALSTIQKSEFPILAEKLSSIAQTAEKNELSEVYLRKKIEEMGEVLKKGIQRFEPLAQKVVKIQSLSGFHHFDEEFLRKYNQDLLEITDEKKQKKIILKKVDRWVDETVEFLTITQKSNLAENMKKFPPPLFLQIESRRLVFDRFRQVRIDDQKRKIFLSQLFTEWDSLQTQEFQNARKEYFNKVIDWVVTIALHLNEKQKKNLINNLKKRASELQRLSSK